MLNRVFEPQTEQQSGGLSEAEQARLDEATAVLSVARDLGVPYSLLFKWRKEFNEKVK